MLDQTCGCCGNRVKISFSQIVLIASMFAFSWLGMQIVHEFGHVIGAKLTGGTVSRVVLYPFVISQTKLSQDPHPLTVAWFGPLIGVVLPFLAFGVAKFCQCPGIYLFRFFAGFCLITNGVYIGIGAIYNAADAGVLMLYGSPQWLLLLFWMVSWALGFYLWNHQGPHFGLGGAKGKVSKTAALVSAVMFLAVFMVEIALNSW